MDKISGNCCGIWNLPYALLDDSGKVIWTNIAFENVVHQPKGYNKSITSLFPTITRDRLPDDSGVDEAQYELEYEGCEYVAKSSVRFP